MKGFLVFALVATGALTWWKHLTTARVVPVPLGGIMTERVSNNARIGGAPVRDLIGGIPYGYTGHPALTVGDALKMKAGGADDISGLDNWAV